MLAWCEGIFSFTQTQALNRMATKVAPQHLKQLDAAIASLLAAHKRKTLRLPLLQQLTRELVLPASWEKM